MSEIEITTPSTIFDMADLAEAARIRSQFEWLIVRKMWETGRTYTLRVDGQIIGIAAFIPIEDGCAEASFHFRPAAARYMLGIVRAIRLTLNQAPYRAIVTLCRTTAGKRIARSAGFVFKAQSELGEVWAYGRSCKQSDGRYGAAADAGAAKPDPIPAAHEPGADGEPAGRN